jgi:iduronate 2-sulfatase
MILCSDHGWHLGEQSAWSKMTNFEVATRVPLLIAAPGNKPGRTQSFAELVDLYPTVCELAGVPAPSHLEEEARIESLREPSKLTQKIALSQHVRYCEKYMGRALRTDRFRFVQWTATETEEAVAQELYDHDTDPHETVNVADRPEFA